MEFSETEVQLWYQQLENKPAAEILEFALQRFHPKLAIAHSMQIEDMVVLDIAWKIQPNVRVFTLDTGRLHQETYDMIDWIGDRYGIPIEILFPDSAEVEAMVRAKGMNLFYESLENRHECCGVRKVHPLRKHLAQLDGWITGLRRDQWNTRASVPVVEIDTANGGILKFNPIAQWTYQQIDDYVKANRLPAHALYAKGFTSIGCLPCTRATQPGENPRAGRWWWEEDSKKECGLHVAEPS